MRIRALFCTIIGLFYDDDLFASLAALEDDSNLSVSPLMAWSREEPKWVLFRACRLEERVRRLYNDRKETKIVTFDHLDDLGYPLALTGTDIVNIWMVYPATRTLPRITVQMFRLGTSRF